VPSYKVIILHYVNNQDWEHNLFYLILLIKKKQNTQERKNYQLAFDNFPSGTKQSYKYIQNTMMLQFRIWQYTNYVWTCFFINSIFSSLLYQYVNKNLITHSGTWKQRCTLKDRFGTNGLKKVTMRQHRWKRWERREMKSAE
jgi:hypothetical protein